MADFDSAAYDQAIANDAPANAALAAEAEAEARRQYSLANQPKSPMIAPSPLAMTAVEKMAAGQRQDLTNMGGTADMASMYDEGALADKTFTGQPNPEQVVETPQSAPDVFPSDLQAPQQPKAAGTGLSMEPFNEMLRAQEKLNKASQTLEQDRQLQLIHKAQLQNNQVEEFNASKQKYEVSLNERMKALDDQLKQVDADARNASKSNQELFAEKSTGQKIAAGLAMILGVAHAGLSGGGVKGGNMGAQIIEDSLEQDRKSYLNKFANSKEMLDLKRKNMDDYTQTMQNQMLLADKQKLLQMQVISTKLDQAASVYRGSAAGAMAMQNKAEIRNRMQQMQAQITQQEAMKEVGFDNIDSMPILAAAARLGMKPEEVYKDRRERSIDLPGGKVGYVKKASMAKDATDIVGASEIVQRNLEIIADIVRKNPLKVKGGSLTSAGTEAKAALGRITAAMKGMEQLGALDNGVTRLVDNIIKDPTSLINMADYKKIAAELKAGVNYKLNGMGVKGYAPELNINFTPVKEGTVQTRFGQYLK